MTENWTKLSEPEMKVVTVNFPGFLVTCFELRVQQEGTNEQGGAVCEQVYSHVYQAVSSRHAQQHLKQPSPKAQGLPLPESGLVRPHNLLITKSRGWNALPMQSPGEKLTMIHEPDNTIYPTYGCSPFGRAPLRAPLIPARSGLLFSPGSSAHQPT